MILTVCYNHILSLDVNHAPNKIYFAIGFAYSDMAVEPYHRIKEQMVWLEIDRRPFSKVICVYEITLHTRTCI